MTSVQTEYLAPEPFTKFFEVQTLSYRDNEVDGDMPLPFSVTDGVLDIVVTNSDVQDFINNGNYNRSVNTKCTTMGGRTLVTAVGPNIKTWLDNYLSVDDVNSITLTIPSTMVKIQPRGTDYSSDPLYHRTNTQFHDVLPSGDEYIMGGNTASSFLSTWVFDSPMTLSYLSGGNVVYVTFSSVFNFYN